MSGSTTNPRLRRIAVSAFLVALVAVSCAENEPETAEPSTTATSSPVDDDADADPAESDDEDNPAADDEGGDGPSPEVQWAIDFVGGTHGPADGEPIRIGVSGAFDFLQMEDDAAQAAADFVNAELGGVDGRPLELVFCNMAVPEDGSACAAEFANDPDLTAVLAAGALEGSADFWAGLAEKKPMLQGAPLGVADFTTDAAPTYNSGALGAGASLSIFALEFEPSTIALVVTDDTAGRAGQSVFAPIVEDAGVDLRTVFVPPTATAPEVSSALQAAGADQADVIVSGLFEQGCIAMIDALTSLGIDTVETPFLTPSTCWGDVVQQHQANIGAEYAWPNGWHFAWGYNPWNPSFENGTQTYISVMEAAGFGNEMFGAGGDFSFSGILAIVRALNAAEGDYSWATVDRELRDWAGPHMMQVGSLECGQSATFRSVCADQVGIWQFLDGVWLDSTVVDISPILQG
ncbi:MAG: ABC transporter substrate-binding protein [Actinomycetota bacterium]